MHIVRSNNSQTPNLQLVPTQNVPVAATPVTSQSTDAELILACQQGNTRAFNILAKRHERTIRGQFYKLAPDWQSHHEDMTQEVLMRMWKSIKSLRNPSAFKGWINQIVNNLFYDELRKRPKVTITSMDEPFKTADGEDTGTRDIPDDRAQPDEVLHRLHIVQKVNEAMNELPENFKNIIVLRELHGLPYDEIAEITNTELGTVKSRIARARQKIQKQLEPLRCA
jgi:RNA polymerase sigma-70 factor (ECF subfamily)